MWRAQRGRGRGAGEEGGPNFAKPPGLVPALSCASNISPPPPAITRAAHPALNAARYPNVSTAGTAAAVPCSNSKFFTRHPIPGPASTCETAMPPTPRPRIDPPKGKNTPTLQPMTRQSSVLGGHIMEVCFWCPGAVVGVPLRRGLGSSVLLAPGASTPPRAPAQTRGIGQSTSACEHRVVGQREDQAPPPRRLTLRASSQDATVHSAVRFDTPHAPAGVARWPRRAARPPRRRPPPPPPPGRPHAGRRSPARGGWLPCATAPGPPPATADRREDTRDRRGG